MKTIDTVNFEEASLWVNMIGKLHDMNVESLIIDDNGITLHSPSMDTYSSQEQNIIKFYLEAYNDENSEHDYPEDDLIMTPEKGNKIIVEPWLKDDKWVQYWKENMNKIVEKRIQGMRS